MELILLFLLTGIFMIIIGIFKRKKYATAKNSYILVQGVITEIERVRSGKTYVYVPLLSYTVNGVEYKIRKGNGRMGQQCGVYYNPNDPSDAVAEGDFSGTSHIVVGFIFVAFVAFTLFTYYTS